MSIYTTCRHTAIIIVLPMSLNSSCKWYASFIYNMYIPKYHVATTSLCTTGKLFTSSIAVVVDDTGLNDSNVLQPVESELPCGSNSLLQHLIVIHPQRRNKRFPVTKMINYQNHAHCHLSQRGLRQF